MAGFKKSAKMLALEKRLNEELEEALPRLANRHGLTGAAKELKLSKATLNYWLLRFGIRTERVFLGPDESVTITKTARPQ